MQLAESQRGEVENGLSVPTGFAQVQLSLPATPPATENGSNQLQVEVGGVRLTAGSGYPAEQLARLVRELAGSC